MYVYNSNYSYSVVVIYMYTYIYILIITLHRRSREDGKLVRQGFAPLVLVLASGTTPAGPSPGAGNGTGEGYPKGLPSFGRVGGTEVPRSSGAGGRSPGRVRWSGSPLGTLRGPCMTNSCALVSKAMKDRSTVVSWLLDADSS